MTRVLIVHYAGDYREADRLRREEGRETYFGHGYVLDMLEQMRAAYGEVGFLCSLAPAYWEQLPNGVTVIGANANPDRDPAKVIALIERFAPTHLVVNGPMLPLIRWGLRSGVRLGVVLADSFANPYYRWIRFRALPRLLNDSRVTLVANHGVNAARGLVDLGVSAEKVMAWDFPHQRTPFQFPLKSRRGPAPQRLLYVGSISAKKGVGDLIRAVGLLDGRRNVQLDIVGAGQTRRFERLADRLGLSERIAFKGLVPNDAIPAMMHAADAVIVPSRHSFPEGLPLTLYEGLASRTPVVASDHPMFKGHLVHRRSAVIFRAGSPLALADAIDELFGDAALYARVSAGAHVAWEHMQVSLKWGEMIDRWVRDTPDDRHWLTEQTLAASDRASATAGTS